MAVGSLLVEVAANVARFSSDMDRVASIAEANARKIDKAFGIVSTSLKALGAGAAAGLTLDAIKSKIEGVIKSAADLQQLSERTGATVESLSGLASVAKLSGTDTDALATGLQKLSKSMIDAQSGGAANVAAFKALGISVNELKGLRPDEVFKLIADRMANFADGAGKTTVAQQLLGKAGANLLPVMKDLAEAGDLQVKVTAEQARLADEYEKALVRLNAAQGAIWKRIAMEALPALNEVAKLLLQNATNTDGLKGAVDKLAQDKKLREWAQNAALGFAMVAETMLTMVGAMRAVGGSMEVMGADVGVWIKRAALASRPGDEKLTAELADLMAKREKTIKDADQRYADLWNKPVDFLSRPLRERFTVMNAGQDDTWAPAFEGTTKPQKKPDVPFNPNSGNVGNPAAQYRTALQAQLDALDGFVKREAALLKEHETQIAWDAQYGLITGRQASDERVALIRETLDKTLNAYAVEEAAIKEAFKRMEAAERQKPASEARTNSLKDIAAQQEKQLADLANKRAAAVDNATRAENAEARVVAGFQAAFDQQLRDRANADKIANESMQLQIDLMGQDTLAVLKANAARQIQLDLEQRIYELRKNDPAADVSKAVAQAAIQTARATSLIEQQYRKQRDAAFGANEALRKYAEDASNLGAQVEQAFTSAFKGMEDALVSFVTTGKMNFKSFASSVIADIARILIRASVTGPLAAALQAGISGAFRGSFGSGSTLSASDLSAGTSMANSVFPLTARAAGGPVQAGTMYLVGEKGPELFVPPAAGMIIPNGPTKTIVDRAQQTSRVEREIAGRYSSTPAPAGSASKEVQRSLIERLQQSSRLEREIAGRYPAAPAPAAPRETQRLIRERARESSRVEREIRSSRDVARSVLERIRTSSRMSKAATHAVEHRAAGGPVVERTPYVVGERGPELFVPAASATAVQASAQRPTAGTTIVQNVNISTGVAATVRAEMLQMLPAFQRATMAGMADAKMRGGAIAAALR